MGVFFPTAVQSLGADWVCERSVPDLDANLVLLLALCALGRVAQLLGLGVAPSVNLS